MYERLATKKSDISPALVGSEESIEGVMGNLPEAGRSAPLIGALIGQQVPGQAEKCAAAGEQVLDGDRAQDGW